MFTFQQLFTVPSTDEPTMQVWYGKQQPEINKHAATVHSYNALLNFQVLINSPAITLL